MKDDREILAFAHIPKAGGTTFIHILRNNFLFTSCDVRFLSKESNGVFSADDMKMTLRFNPFVKCIMGHNVRPHSNLGKVFKRTHYVVLLRDPVARSVSHYLHRAGMHGETDIKADLEQKRFHNLQTKFIAGKGDIDTAKRILKEDVFLVGVLEAFDQFLALLLGMMQPGTFKPSYIKKRVSNQEKRKEKIFSDYFDEFTKINDFDIELYAYARDIVIPGLIKQYGGDMEGNLSIVATEKPSIGAQRLRSYLNFVIRKLYYEPILAVIRMSNGLPIKGLPKR